MTLAKVEKTLRDMSSLQYLGLNIYLEFISPEIVPDQSCLEILIEETESMPDYQADNSFFGYKESYQLSLFYGTDLELSVERTILEIMLQKQLVDEGYMILGSAPHYTDPTTKQVIKNITITRTQGLDEIV